MPILISRLEPNLYLAEWTGIVSAADTMAAMLHLAALADAHESARYVLLIDMRRVVSFPLDTRYYGQLANYDERLSAVLVINYPELARTLGRIVSRFTDRSIRFCDNLQQAETLAQTILRNNFSSSASSGNSVRF